MSRIRGVKVNASCKSHVELSALCEPDSGDVEQLGKDLCTLKNECPFVTIYGGCCGTDTRHIESVIIFWPIGGFHIN